ncbi:MAG TPA: hypothetical protein VG992_05105 [Candidatus Saccharimonadales bacterium]|nr:hypothetical protein [Candidatus Saccharimonadales bacterium]
MGRLAPLLRRWGPPVGLALIILFGLNAVVRADPPPTPTELSAYLQDHQLQVSSVPSHGFDQIAYNYNQQVVKITDDGYNHLEPAVDGPDIVWQGVINGAGQIFLYNVVDESLTQLTFTGTHDAPAIYQGKAVWQTWDGQNWQIDYYDGNQVRQITSDPHSSIRPSLDGQQIIYAEQLGDNSWQAMSYDLASGQATVLAVGDTANTAYPHFTSDGGVATAYVAY